MWIALLVAAGRLAAFLVMLLALYEPTATFEDLERSPGFGLVVRATELRKTLEAALSGKSHVRGRNRRCSVLPRYRATLSTMQQTLAVSYRWQPEEVQIDPSATINMNAFQMRELLTAVNHSTCAYVWLDRLSVPQHECKLKYTLLARMMTVYASAGSTLVIRGLEDEGSRYHQRAWTCQEFCVACVQASHHHAECSRSRVAAKLNYARVAADEGLAASFPRRGGGAVLVARQSPGAENDGRAG